MRLDFLYIVAELQDSLIEQHNLTFRPARPRSVSLVAVQEHSFIHLPLLLRSRYFFKVSHEPADPLVDLQLAGLLFSVSCTPNMIRDFWDVVAKCATGLIKKLLLLCAEHKGHV